MIVRCSHCKKLFSADKFDSHECELPLKGVKRIEVVYFRDGSYKNKKLVTDWGTDGISYTFEVVQRKAIPIVMTTDEILQHKRTDEDLTEPSAETADSDSPMLMMLKGLRKRSNRSKRLNRSH